MAHPNTTPPATRLEEAVTVLFCLIDDAYLLLDPEGGGRYASLKRLSDSEVITLALFQQLRGVESERSFLRDAARFFSHLFPGVVDLHPSSFHRRVRKLRRFLEPLRRTVASELLGDPETLIVDSTLLSVLHPREVKRSAGWGCLSAEASWARWGFFSVYGAKLHLICSTNRVPVSYELTAATSLPLPAPLTCCWWKNSWTRPGSGTKWCAGSLGISPTAPSHSRRPSPSAASS
jgi:hypothetical protein